MIMTKTTTSTTLSKLGRSNVFLHRNKTTPFLTESVSSPMMSGTRRQISTAAAHYRYHSSIRRRPGEFRVDGSSSSSSSKSPSTSSSTTTTKSPSQSSSTTNTTTTTTSKTTSTTKRPSYQQLKTIFLTSAIPMIGFGYMDNTVMIRAGDAIDQTIGLRFGLATLTAAAFGQIFSDVSGVLFGGAFESFLKRIGLISQSSSTTLVMLDAVQRQSRLVKGVSMMGSVCGVIVGCLCGMSHLWFMDLEAKERNKRLKELDTIFETVLTEGNEMLGAERSSLFVVDEEKEMAWSRVAVGMDYRENKKKNKDGKDNDGGERAMITVPINGRSVVGSCIRTGLNVNILDAYKDDRFNHNVDVKSGFHTKSILCVPVMREGKDRIHNGGGTKGGGDGRNGDGSGDVEVVGVVELLNKKGGGSFDENDERAAAMLARHVGIFLAQVDKK